MRNFLQKLLLAIAMVIVPLSLIPRTSLADNYDTSRKIYEAAKEVDAYQKSRIEGTYIDYSVTPDWVKLLWSLVAIGALLFLLAVSLSWFEDLSVKNRKITIILLLIAAFIIILPIAIYYVRQLNEYYEIKKYQDNDDREQLNLLEKTLNQYKEISAEESRDFMELINGNSRIFKAGKINPVEILNLNESTKRISGKYTVIDCEMNCKIDFLPINHPIATKVRRVGFYLCKDKSQDLLLTGIYFIHGSYYLEKYHAAAATYLEKIGFASGKSVLSESREFLIHAIDDTNYNAGSASLTDANGFSFIWGKSDKQGNEIGLDICGNHKPENAWEKNLL